MQSATLIVNDFSFLRQLGLNGDASASAELRERYGHGLSRVVRRVLRRGRGEGELAEFILEQAAEVRSRRTGLQPEELVAEILDRLCELIAGQGIASRLDTGRRVCEATIAA